MNHRLLAGAARARESLRRQPGDPRAPRRLARALRRRLGPRVGAGVAFGRRELGRAARDGRTRLAAALAGLARELRSEPFRRRLALAAGLSGALLLVIADFSRLREVTVVTVVSKEVDGGEEHLYAMAALGVLALLATSRAALRRNRGAMRAMVALGLVALAVALAVDLPALDDTDGIGTRFDKAAGGAGVGFARELGGALLLLGAGGTLLRITPTPRRRREPAPRPGSAKAAGV